VRDPARSNDWRDQLVTIHTRHPHSPAHARPRPSLYRAVFVVSGIRSRDARPKHPSVVAVTVAPLVVVIANELALPGLLAFLERESRDDEAGHRIDPRPADQCEGEQTKEG